MSTRYLLTALLINALCLERFASKFLTNKRYTRKMDSLYVTYHFCSHCNYSVVTDKLPECEFCLMCHNNMTLKVWKVRRVNRLHKFGKD